MDTKIKGDLAESAVIKDSMLRGYKVAIPFGDDWRYDLIVQRHNNLERVQVKYIESDRNKLFIRCYSSSMTKSRYIENKYTADEIDWIAVYDKTTDRCFYISSNVLGNGRTSITIQIEDYVDNY